MKNIIPLITLLLAGCSTFVELPPLEPMPDAEKILWSIQYQPQELKNDCGAACMATLARHYGKHVTLDLVTAELKESYRGGVIPIEMLYWARKNGLDAKLYEGGLNDMRKNIQEGKPLILFIHPMPDIVRAAGIRVGHYVVAVGFDDINGFAIVHTGDESFKDMSYRELIYQWRRSGYLTLSISK